MIIRYQFHPVFRRRTMLDLDINCSRLIQERVWGNDIEVFYHGCRLAAFCNHQGLAVSTDDGAFRRPVFGTNCDSDGQGFTIIGVGVRSEFECLC